MRIAYLTQELSLANGWGRYSVRLLEQMPALGVEPLVLTAEAEPAAGPEASAAACLPPWPPDPSWPRLLREARRLRPRVADCDAIHCLVEPYLPLAARLAPGKPLFVTGHGTYLLKPLETWRLRHRYQRAYRRSSGILCNSAYTRDRLLQQLPDLENALVIPLGVEPRFLAAGSEGTARDGRVILSVGSLKPRKGYEYALRAFARVHREFPDCRYVIVGRAGHSDYVQRVVDLIRELGIEDSVRLLHDVDEQELLGWYARASLHVLASTSKGSAFEGFGLVHLEAGAAGLPTIGTAGSGNETAIRDGETGFVVPQKDVGALAAGIARLLREEPLRRKLGQEGRRHAEAHSWSRVAEQVVDRYRSASRPPPASSPECPGSGGGSRVASE